MKAKKTILATLFSLMYATTAGAQEVNKTNNKTSTEDIEVIEVTGLRGNAISSADAKRISSQVSDSISSTEIGKFPDTNIGDSLQRIPGIQISRSRGEASGLAIRGLDEVATLLNGRNYFGGGTGSSIKRSASLQDVPPVIVKAIDVYKSAAADQVEGGIGGVVDIRRQQASDIDEFTFTTSMKTQYGDLADKWSPTISALIGDVWDLSDDNGELSALFAISYQSREFREDATRATGRKEVTNADAGKSVPADTLRITGLNSKPAWGDRKRTVINGSVVWELDDDKSYFIEGGYTDYSDVQKLEEFNFNGYGSITDIDTSNASSSRFADSVSYDNMKMDVLSQIDARETETYDLATGFEISSGNFDYYGEVSIVNTNNEGAFRNMRLRDNIATIPVTIDHSGGDDIPPHVDYGNFDPANADNFNLVQWRHASRQFEGTERAARFDVTYNTDDGIFSSYDFGARYNIMVIDQTQQNIIIRDFGAELTTFTGGDPLGLVGLNTFDDYFSTISGTDFPSRFVAVNPDDLISRDAEIRSQYGINGQASAQVPRDLFEYEEKNIAIYAKANLDTEVGDMFLSGNFGVRYVETDTETDSFFQSGLDASNNAVYSPLDISDSYNELLPSMNLKLDLNDEVVLRMAASRTMARPHFGNLAPALGLNFAEGTGSGGNPLLKPFTANNFDLGIEYYFDDASYVSAVVFHKKVNGFLQTTEVDEVLNGQPFKIRRQANGGSGTIDGLEFSYQQMLDFLPINGFGIQANYTYVDSDVPSPNPELENIALEGLSENSYNIVAFYEDETFSARLAYNYRSEYLATTQYYNTAYKQLDASFSYDLNESISFTLDAVNLLQAERREYWADDQTARQWYATERRLLVGMSYSF